MIKSAIESAIESIEMVETDMAKSIARDAVLGYFGGVKKQLSQALDILNQGKIFVVCLNDGTESASFSEDQAQLEVDRLTKEHEHDKRFFRFYHIHEVPMLPELPVGINCSVPHSNFKLHGTVTGRMACKEPCEPPKPLKSLKELRHDLIYGGCDALNYAYAALDAIYTAKFAELIKNTTPHEILCNHFQAYNDEHGRDWWLIFKRHVNWLLLNKDYCAKCNKVTTWKMSKTLGGAVHNCRVCGYDLPAILHRKVEKNCDWQR